MHLRQGLQRHPFFSPFFGGKKDIAESPLGRPNYYNKF